MKKKTKIAFAVSWAEYNHNDDSLNGDVYGLYETLEKAKSAIKGSIAADVETLLEDYEDPEDIPFEGKTPKKIAAEIMDENFHYDSINFVLPDSREYFYSIRRMGVAA